MEGFENLESLNGILAILGIFAIFFIIISIGLLVIYIMGTWKLYQKAGKNGWESIIPFYNKWTLVEISGLAWWWFLIVIATTISTIIDDDLNNLAIIITLFGNFCCNYNISKKLNRDTGFAVLMTLFPVIIFPIIGFSNNYQFDNTVKVSEIGPFEKNNNNTKQQEKETTDSTFCPKCGTPVEKENKYCKHCGNKL